MQAVTVCVGGCNRMCAMAHLSMGNEAPPRGPSPGRPDTPPPRHRSRCTPRVAAARSRARSRTAPGVVSGE
eukprot:scaffold92528_cov51-Phaeocystis_antarctica.AAC.2